MIIFFINKKKNKKNLLKKELNHYFQNTFPYFTKQKRESQVILNILKKIGNFNYFFLVLEDLSIQFIMIRSLLF